MTPNPLVDSQRASKDIYLDAIGNTFSLPIGEKVYWRISGYSLVQSEESKILMVIPTWNTLWQLPGGGIEECESIPDGIRRECYEETGYSIKLSDEPFYVSERNFYLEKMFYHSVIIIYLASLLTEKQDDHVINTCDGDEIKNVDWVSPVELNEINCHPVIYPSIQKLKTHPLE